MRKEKKTCKEVKTMVLWTKVAVQDGERYKRSIEIRGCNRMPASRRRARVSSSGTRDCYLSFATLSYLLCLTCETLPRGAFITMNAAQGPHNGLLTRDARDGYRVMVPWKCSPKPSYLSVLAKISCQVSHIHSSHVKFYLTKV